jgi:hypothetical protein
MDTAPAIELKMTEKFCWRAATAGDRWIERKQNGGVGRPNDQRHPEWLL